VILALSDIIALSFPKRAAMPFAFCRHLLPCSLAAFLALGALSSTAAQAQQPGPQQIRASSPTPLAARQSHALAGAGQGSVIQVALRQSRHETAPTTPRQELPSSKLAQLHSEVAFVQDLSSSTVLYDQNSDEARPIASISRLMTALVVAEANLPMDEMLA